MRTKKFNSILIAILLTTAVGVFAQQQAVFQIDPSVARIQQHVAYLASDALNGRRTGSAGADDAAHYIAGEFSRLGLRPAMQRAGGPRKLSQAMALYLQKFPYIAGVDLGKTNALTFTRHGSPVSITLREDWMPLGFSTNGQLEATPAVFVGYGITATELKHDDYAANKASGKIAIAMDGTPDGENPHGQFARYDGVRWKAVAARNGGARALLIISRTPSLKDERMATLKFDNSAGDAGIPVAVISTTALGLTPFALGQLEEWYNRGAKTFENLTASLKIDLIRREVPAYNVIGVLEGSDPKLKNEVIIIGAHYDHLGRGGEGSLAPREGEIHHGADDNASGVAGVLELARIFTGEKPRPKRTLIFMAFSGEEEGLLGSSYYVNHPIAPLANTVAMINMDMIGRMKDRKLIIGGVGTAKEWREVLAAVNTTPGTTTGTALAGNGNGDGASVAVPTNGRAVGSSEATKSFDLTLQEDGYGPSDHSSFYSKQIPVLFFWTGTHNDYHKPSDTWDKINYADEARVVSLVARVIRDIEHSDKRLTYTTAKSDATQRTGGFKVYLGTIPNYADTNDGLLLDGVRDDSPAAKGGLKAGDRIVKIANHDIHNVYDYTYALGEMKAGQEYVFEVMRGKDRLTLKVTPEARK